MASPSGNSSETTSTAVILHNSGSEEDPQHAAVMDERKRRRMELNRESARRSRMRKQKHLDDLMAQVAQLRRENSHMVSSISITTQQFLNVEVENSVLRARVVELSQRLDSLNEILNCTRLSSSDDGNDDGGGGLPLPLQGSATADSCFMVNDYSWYMSMAYVLNQPIMASDHGAAMCSNADEY